MQNRTVDLNDLHSHYPRVGFHHESAQDVEGDGVSMATHLIQAKKISLQNWILFDVTANEPIGEERAYQYASRSRAYIAANNMWPANSVWQGKRVHNGYQIEVI